MDQIESLIFDEIDVGISGRTAQMVSEKMSILGKNHQIICITHLPQIAAMADTHFVIEKISSAKETETRIRRLSDEQSTEELARMLGGVEITQAVLAECKRNETIGKKSKTIFIIMKLWQYFPYRSFFVRRGLPCLFQKGKKFIATDYLLF